MVESKGDFLCLCNKVTEEFVRNSIVTLNLSTLDDVVKNTHAGESRACCSGDTKHKCCHAKISLLLEEYKSNDLVRN